MKRQRIFSVFALLVPFALAFTSCDLIDGIINPGVVHKKLEIDFTSSHNNNNSTYAVGDVVLSDGKVVKKASVSNMTDEQKAAAVAVIFYAGDSEGTLGEKVLGVGLQNTNGENPQTLGWVGDMYDVQAQWLSIDKIQCSMTKIYYDPYEGNDFPVKFENSGSVVEIAGFYGDTDGSDNWTALVAALRSKGYDDTEKPGNYPAWEWVNSYAEKHSLGGTNYADGWYMPSIAELCFLGITNSALNASLSAAGGSQMTGSYFSSTQVSAGDTGHVWSVRVDDENHEGGYINASASMWDDRHYKVCCIRVF